MHHWLRRMDIPASQEYKTITITHMLLWGLPLGMTFPFSAGKANVWGLLIV